MQASVAKFDEWLREMNGQVGSRSMEPSCGPGRWIDARTKRDPRAHILLILSLPSRPHGRASEDACRTRRRAGGSDNSSAINVLGLSGIHVLSMAGRGRVCPAARIRRDRKAWGHCDGIKAIIPHQLCYQRRQQSGLGINKYCIKTVSRGVPGSNPLARQNWK